MPIGTLSPGTDEFDLAVNFGGLNYHMFFGDGPYCTPLPPTPPTAGTSCRCPSCASEGWYAQSPACLLWRACCESCSGTRFALVYETGRRPRREPCQECAQAWRESVRCFREALRSPWGTADRMRREAASAAGADDPTALRCRRCGRGQYEHTSADTCTHRSVVYADAEGGVRP